MRRALGLLALCALWGCTDSSLYSLSGATRHGPDRVDLAGTVCAPLAAGRLFPVRVLFLFQGRGSGLDYTGLYGQAVSTVTSRISNPAVKYGVGTFWNTALGEMKGGFGPQSDLDAAITRMSSFTQSGEVSLLAPLEFAEAILSGDMLTACPGTLARTRYLVVLVFTDPDALTATLAGGSDSTVSVLSTNCTGSAQQITECVLRNETAKIRDLQQVYGVGEIQVQPVYVFGGTPDPDANADLLAIAEAGGTSPKSTGNALIENTLASLDYTSLQRPMNINKAGLYAFNRNAVVRAGQVVPDSDGDGLSDDEEKAFGISAPDNPDTDGDGLGDGIEIQVGTDPAVPTVVGACEPYIDTDRDGLTDCEEHLLGTDACTGDTDGDGLADGVEFLGGTDPLNPEQARDDDGDGVTNLEEARVHTDVNSSDLGFHADHAYGYELSDGGHTPDGRVCYAYHVSNIQLVHTLALADGSKPAGENDIALYFSVFPADDPNAAGISRLTVVPVNFTADEQRQPPDAVIQVNDADFELKP